MTLRRVTEKARLKQLLDAVRQADAAHDARMELIAEAAGMSLAALRSLPMAMKDRIIFKHREAGNG